MDRDSPLTGLLTKPPEMRSFYFAVHHRCITALTLALLKATWRCGLGP
jgi:hypothetical protein